MRSATRLLPAVLAAGLLLAAATAPAQAAKRKGGPINITQAVNAPIPDGTGDAYGALTSTINVRKGRGRRVRDVNLTLQTLGVTGSNAGSNLGAFLTAPSGATTTLFFILAEYGPPTPSIGPITLDDESRFGIGDSPTVGTNPLLAYSPWAATVRPAGDELAVMDDGPARGAWRLTVFDTQGGQTSNLAFWRISVLTGRRYRTK